MEGLVKGDVVVTPFPYSTGPDSAGAIKKNRPALVLAAWQFAKNHSNYLLSMISSKPGTTGMAIPIDITDFSDGALFRKSYVRSLYLYTADKSIIIKRIGTLNSEKVEAVVTMIVDKLRGTEKATSQAISKAPPLPPQSLSSP